MGYGENRTRCKLRKKGPTKQGSHEKRNKKTKSANQSETVRLDLTGEEAVISIQKRPPSDSPLMVTIKSECVEAETGPIKEEIKTDPVEAGVPGIRVALERTQDQRYSVAFTSDCHRRGGDTDDD